MSLRWYCCRTAPRGEATATFFIEALGLKVANLTVQVPVSRSTQPWRSGVRRVLMFPSYLFVRFDLDEPTWRRVPTQPGIQRLFGSSAESPTPLPVDAVENLLARPEQALDALASRPLITPGVRARVTLGPFEGRSGACCYSTVERVTILLDLMGRPSPVEFPAEAVEAVE